MSYSTTNPHSSEDSAAHVRSDQIAAGAPTRSRNTTHRRTQFTAHSPQSLMPYPPSEPHFRAIQPQSAEVLQPPRLSDSPATLRSYTGSFHQKPSSPTTDTKGVSHYSTSTGSAYSPAELRASFLTSSESTISSNHYQSVSSLVSPTPTIRHPHILPIATHSGDGSSEQLQGIVRGYDLDFSDHLFERRTGTFAIPDSGFNSQEPSQQQSSPRFSSAGTSSNPFPHSQLECHGPSSEAPSYSNPGPLLFYTPTNSSPSSTTTTLRLNLNVNTDRHVVEPTRMWTSSIPMRNGTPQGSTVTPSVSGPPPSQFQFSPHSPTSTHASMSISTQGNSVQLKAHVTFSPLAASEQPSYSLPQSPQTRIPNSKPVQHIAHSVEVPSFVSSPELSQKPARNRVNVSSLESRTSHRISPLRAKKPAKMHACPECSREFPRPSGLKTHMNTHSNDKPFACEFPGCFRTFSVKSNAKRHLKTHGAEFSSPTNDSGLVSISKSVFTTKTPITNMKANAPLSYFDGNDTAQVHIDDFYSASGKHISTSADTLASGPSVGHKEPSHPEPSFYKLRWVTPRHTERLDRDASRGRTAQKSQLYHARPSVKPVGGPSHHNPSLASSGIGSANAGNNWPKIEDSDETQARFY